MGRIRTKISDLKQKARDQRGVTLIEMLAVVVILAILAAVGVPIVLAQIQKARINTDQIQRATDRETRCSGRSMTISRMPPTRVIGHHIGAIVNEFQRTNRHREQRSSKQYRLLCLQLPP